jgi:hypothetical protein
MLNGLLAAHALDTAHPSTSQGVIFRLDRPILPGVWSDTISPADNDVVCTAHSQKRLSTGVCWVRASPLGFSRVCQRYEGGTTYLNNVISQGQPTRALQAYAVGDRVERAGRKAESGERELLRGLIR